MASLLKTYKKKRQQHIVSCSSTWIWLRLWTCALNPTKMPVGPGLRFRFRWMEIMKLFSLIGFGNKRGERQQQQRQWFLLRKWLFMEKESAKNMRKWNTSRICRRAGMLNVIVPRRRKEKKSRNSNKFVYTYVKICMQTWVSIIWNEAKAPFAETERERDRETVCGELNLHRSSEIRAADWARARVRHRGRLFNSSTYAHTYSTNLV